MIGKGKGCAQNCVPRCRVWGGRGQNSVGGEEDRNGTAQGSDNITSHATLTVVEGRSELFVCDSKGVLVHRGEGVVCRAHVGGEIGAVKLRGGVGVAGFGGWLGVGGGIGVTHGAFVGKEGVHWKLLCYDMY